MHKLEAASGTTLGASLAVDFPAPVEARYFRLAVSASGRPALAEFQFFQP